MGMSIEEAIEGLKTERQLSVDNMDIYDSEESRRDAVYYVSILETAIETMRKYQQVEEIYKNWCYPTHINAVEAMNKLGEVLKDGKID